MYLHSWASVVLVAIGLSLYPQWSHGQTVVNRWGEGLTEVPSDIPVDAVQVDLSGNQLTSIGDGAFSPYTQLNALYLEKNQISSVSPTAFSNTVLSQLYISRNLLTTMPDLSAINATLRYLRLADNQISAFDSGVCSAKLLTVLFLYNNQITSIEPRAFAECTALLVLTMGGNLLTKMPDLTGLDTLGAIHVDDNQITSIEPTAFDECCTALRDLNLGNNLLTTVPDLSTILNSLANIKLSGNPLVCDSRLLWLKEEGGVSVDDFTCAGPPCFVDRLFSTLTREDLSSTMSTLTEEPVMNLTCDDKTRSLQFDGVEQAAPDENIDTWDKASTYTIPCGTKVIRVECENTGYPGGLKASADNGLVTDDSWECSAEGFDSGMGNATVQDRRSAVAGVSDDADWIWTPNESYDTGDRIAYCQKTLAW